MRRFLALLSSALLSTWAVCGPALAVDARDDGAVVERTAERVSIAVDPLEVRTVLGGRVSVTSTVRNQTNRPVNGLVGHLNILSTDGGTYVDPEDWSSHRTQFLDRLPAHGSTSLTWPIQAVNDGSLVVYIAVIDTRRQQVVASAPIPLQVARRRTINAQGILPLVLGVPTGVALVLAVTSQRRRRRIRRG
jgi:hypothetical protein